MKTRHFLLLILSLLLFLVGCFSDELPETEPLPSVTATQPPETFPVREDIFYFSNELEYNRLYSISQDGTDLRLILDESCYSVFRHADTVYFLTDWGLEGYHIPTAQRQSLTADVQKYQISGTDLIYTVPGTDYFTQDFHWLDLKTGEDSLLFTLEMPEWAFSNGVLYYSAYDYSASGSVLKAYHLATASETVLSGSENYASYYHLTADEAGIYCVFGDQNGQNWIYANAEGSQVLDLSDTLPWFGQIVSVLEDGFLFLDYGDPYETICTLCHFSGDGNRTVLATAEDEGSFYVTGLGNSHWLVSHSRFEGWGETTEYGYYTHMSDQRRYFLLDESLSLQPLDTTGPLGAMFKDGDFPILDSSTARIPVTSALYDLFVMGYGYEGPQPLCSTTHGAWLNIADRNVDLAFLAAPTPEEQAYLKERGVEVEMKLYGGDGLVFIGNTENPVSDLSHEQLIAIYRGEITNWSQVGGPDEPIRVYFRDDQSGSQRLFENLLFKGQTIPDFYALGFPMIDTMSDIVDTISWDPYAIGYSIMTYLDEVYAQENLKVFSVGGVLPTAETVTDQSYPYNTKGYLVIRSDEPENSPARRLFNWFGCPVSDELLKNCSVSPLYE